MNASNELGDLFREQLDRAAARAKLSPDNRALRDHYALLTIQTLKRAFDQGLVDHERFLRDINFAPLRPYPSFQVLIRSAATPRRVDRDPVETGPPAISSR
jgi:hypothetical protein